LQENYSCGELPLAIAMSLPCPQSVGFGKTRRQPFPLNPKHLYYILVVVNPYLNSGGDLVSTGELIQGLHARDAVGPLKNGFYIIANDYDVAVAA